MRERKLFLEHFDVWGNVLVNSIEFPHNVELRRGEDKEPTL